MRRSDAALRVIEAAYAPAASERAWLDGILSELDGLGLGESLGYTVDGTNIATISERCGDYTASIERTKALPRDLHLFAHRPSPPIVYARAQWAVVAEVFRTPLREIERRGGGAVPKLLGIVATDAVARGAFLGVRGEPPLAPRMRSTLMHTAAHVAAAYRLRAQTTCSEDADAVCAPDGRLLHGSRAAVARREPLAVAVRRLDAARGRLRRLDPEEAVARWTAMVDGRWTLVERVERDGKQLILAHRNDAPSTISSLRAREAQVATLAALGHSDKYIAYELGIERSSVATHLRRALTKLRFASRRDLVRVFGPLSQLRARGGS